MESITIRTIEPTDNPFIAAIIRHSLAEFGANKPGTVFFDDTTDRLFELFRREGSTYFVATIGDELLGGAGIYPSAGLPDGVCELVKMYLKKEARGHGTGVRLINHCLEFARNAGYTAVYLESMPELQKAVGIYKKMGFDFLDGPMGDTGHFGCDVWMLKKL